MTALAGMSTSADVVAKTSLVDGMLAAQRIYASEKPVVAEQGNAIFGRALYPLLVEDEFDIGPQHSADGLILCVADVRLDNREALADSLQIAPDKRKNLCDAALVLAAWEAWHSDSFDRLRGDFAIAIHDQRNKRLVLARDFLGQRPLFYHRAADVMAFASMPSGLFALPWLDKQADLLVLNDYLASQGQLLARSFFDGIFSVPAGHWLALEGHDVRLHRYWHPPRAGSARGDRVWRTAEARQLLDTAVATRLRGTSVVASQLSGGIDSSAVTLIAAQQLPPGQRISAFTAVPPAVLSVAEPRGRFIDESPLAALSAGRATNIDHYCVAANPADFSNRWDRAVAVFQRPLHGPCNYRWLAEIYDAAKALGATTMLIGQAGNFSISYGLPPTSPYVTAGMPMWRRQLRQIARWVRQVVRAIRNAGHKHHFVMAIASVEDGQAPSIHLSGGDERIAALAMLEFGQHNKGVLAGWGIDLRDPTADRDLVDFCLSLPEDDFFEGGRGRGLARRALADLLPPEVLNDHRRGLQSADWRLALLTDRPALLAEVAHARSDPLANRLIDCDALYSALLSMGNDVSLGQADEVLLRLGGLRALSASHFIRRTFTRNGIESGMTVPQSKQ